MRKTLQSATGVFCQKFKMPGPQTSLFHLSKSVCLFVRLFVRLLFRSWLICALLKYGSVSLKIKIKVFLKKVISRLFTDKEVIPIPNFQKNYFLMLKLSGLIG